MRELRFADIYTMSKILSKLEVKLEPDAKTTEQLFVNFFIRIGENLHLAEKEVNEFLGSMTNMTGKEFSELSLSESIKNIEKFKKLEGIQDFFKSASRLMK